MMRRLDQSGFWCSILHFIHHVTFLEEPYEVGGLTLGNSFILAAGFVKGEGFASEKDALAAVQANQNIMPGWRSVPQIVGLVEYGSFTRFPRMGNPGVVMWRDETTRSTQNRVGLKNPGVVAAAAFLGKHRDLLPKQFGINIAVSPGISDPKQRQREVIEAIQAFFNYYIIPSWFTLNISCPNTEDDPTGHQTETETRDLCQAVMDLLSSQFPKLPLWVKISPGLSEQQYRILMRVFSEVGVGAVIATNTVAQPSPSDASQLAGVGGGRLHPYSVAATRILMEEKVKHGYKVDIVGCGGVFDKASYQTFNQHGVRAVQYWSALIYRGPLAAAVIQHELKNETKNRE